jgi:bacterial regulatory helix-turn-helix proteins, araC family
LRLNEALSLLKNTDLSVTTIANEVGFADSRGLIALIKNRKGCSPSQLRKK